MYSTGFRSRRKRKMHILRLKRNHCTISRAYLKSCCTPIA